MNKFINFDTFIIPKLITIFYAIGCLCVVLSGLGMMFVESVSLAKVIGGLVSIVLGIFGLRIFSEMVMVIFKINENLQKLVDKQEKLN